MSELNKILSGKSEDLTAEEKSFLDLYRSADAKGKKAALEELKGKKISCKLLSKLFSATQDDEKNGKSISTPLLAFTFFYSVSIYILLLSFYFWLWRKDIKPEDKKKSKKKIEK